MLPDDAAREAVQILAVSIDTHAESQTLKRRWRVLVSTGSEEDNIRQIEFPLLQDQEHKVIDRYGLLNPNSVGLPHPATYVIDKTGIVRWKFIETDYKVRPTNAAILDALATVHEAAAHEATAHKAQ